MFRMRCVLLVAVGGLIAGTMLVRIAGAETPPSIAPGTPVLSLEGQDYRGREYRLDEFAEKKAIVVAFLGIECPLAKLYSSRLQQLATEYADKGVAFIGVDSNRQDAPTEITSFVRRHGIEFPFLIDVGCKLADQFGATRTPEVFVLDEKRIVRYQGRIDDQYLPGLIRDRADHQELRTVLDEITAGKPVSVLPAAAVGCLIGRPAAPNENSNVTWSNQISRIVQKNCQECHREGDIGPFALMDYEEAAGWGDMIAEVVRQDRMPPWHANPEYGHFSNARRLTDDERQQIAAWVKNGCPEGDPKDLPAPREFTSGWQLEREPDQVFAMRDEPFQIPADAGPKGVKYQNFDVDPQFTEDKWIVGAEVQPGNRAVVHHIIVYVHPPGSERRQEIFLSAYVPGYRCRKLPEEAAKRIPAGSKLRFQVHYTPNGTPQEDLSRVGFIYTDPETVKNEIITTEVANVRFLIEPNKDNQEFTARSSKAATDMLLLSMSPHMHLRGKSFRYELEKPDGSREVLLDVPHYDFNWQTSYQLAEPLNVEAGSRLYCTAVFDNSDQNLANPDPSKRVHWGDQSWDEMMIGYFDIMVPKKETKFASPLSPSLQAQGLLARLDKDHDGRLSREEAKGRQLLETFFDRIDANKDGSLDDEEFADALGMLDRMKP